jgi:F0F1-type ATP synthase membrane subunit a
MFSPLEQFDIILLVQLYCSLIDFSLSNIILPLICLIILLIILFNGFFKNAFTLLPTGIQLFFEYFLLFIFNLIKQQIGKEGYIYLPLICVLFNIILFLNYLSMIPFGIALTSHIIIIA